ncbi:hypothetical protein BS78_02G050400 [Paspalum vaginatum]|nr:hypothetical protein BS78_02G050400 [Paspalum vaginatum]
MARRPPWNGTMEGRGRERRFVDGGRAGAALVTLAAGPASFSPPTAAASPAARPVQSSPPQVDDSRQPVAQPARPLVGLSATSDGDRSAPCAASVVIVIVTGAACACTLPSGSTPPLQRRRRRRGPGRRRRKPPLPRSPPCPIGQHARVTCL